MAAITQHIPDKSFQLVRYYGWYSNRARGERAKRRLQKPSVDQTAADVAVEILDVAKHQLKKIPSRTWRECIKIMGFQGLTAFKAGVLN